MNTQDQIDKNAMGAIQKILDTKTKQIQIPNQLFVEWFKLTPWDLTEKQVNKHSIILSSRIDKYVLDRLVLKQGNAKLSSSIKNHHEFFGGMLALARANTLWKKYAIMVERVFVIQALK